MDEKGNNPSVILVDSDDMETIQLHRAESMAEPSINFEKLEDKNIEKQPETSHNYISLKASSIRSEIKDLKIEVIMFLYMFSYIMRSVSSTTMIMDKVCLVHLEKPENFCRNLKDHEDLKSLVEKMANNYHVVHGLIGMIPSAILACFWGSWSDKYSRKIPLIIALLGVIIDGLGAILCAAFFYSRVEYYFISALFTGFSGGFVGVLTILYSYASDISTFGNRTMKYALMEVAFGLSMPLGQLAGGWLYRFGYVPVFMVSTGGHILGLVWVLFVLEETRGLEITDSWRVKFQNFWSLQPLKEGIAAATKWRPNYGRAQILLLILSMSIIILSFISTVGLTFFYVHHLYNWDNTKYSTIAAIFSVIGTFILLVVVPVFKRLKLGDATLGIVGTISMMVKFIGLGLATKEWLYYVASLTGIFGNLGTLAARSRISKVTSKNDLGKVFAFLTSAESILPIAAIAVSSQVFNATLKFYPGTIYLVMGSFLLIPLGIFIWLSRLPVVDYEEMHNNPEYENEEKGQHEKAENVNAKF